MSEKLDVFNKFEGRKTPEMDLAENQYLNALMVLDLEYGISEKHLEPMDAGLLRHYVKESIAQYEKEKSEVKYSNSISSFYSEAILRWFSDYEIDIRTVMKLAEGSVRDETSPDVKAYILKEWLKAKHEMETENSVNSKK